MKKLLSILLITRILITPLLASKVIFIQDFQNNTDEKKYDHVGKSLADMVISDIVALGVDGVEVVERARIKILLSELKLQESEYFDQATTQKMGKGLGANYALAGSFTVINGVMRIDARLINVTTSKIHSSFKTKGDEEAIFDLEADLVKNIGKGLEIDFGDVSRDKLSSPKDLDTLVKYADADSLMQKGDYKAATKALNEVRKSEPEFKLGKEAYKEAMRKLYTAKENRTGIISDTEAKLLETALQKSKTNDPQVGFAYQWVLMEIYFRQMMKNAGIDPNDFARTPSLQHGRSRHLRSYRETKSPNDDDVYHDNLKLYVQAYLTAITHNLKLTGPFDKLTGPFARRDTFRKGMAASDRKLLEDLHWTTPRLGDNAELSVDLATFLLRKTNFDPPPYKVDKQYGQLGFRLMDEAAKFAAKSGLHSKRDISRIMDWHGEIFLEHGRTEDAITKWQEILDTYPTYQGFKEVENKIKEALK
ncbi:CsgG/HfaB family protein [Akkermansiaceae bacterium]|nr:CsgG/HfaB family protein [Akkermansiaceae bacterium]